MERLANKKGIEKLWSSHTLHYLDFIGNEHKKRSRKSTWFSAKNMKIGF